MEETHWEKAAKTRMGKYLTRVETGFILKSITPSNMHFVMDVGAEAGRFSLIAKDADAVTVSIDIDSYGLKRLKLKTKQANVIQADARKIPLKDEVFDAVFMIEVLDYIPEVEEALKECYRTLKPDAPLLLSFGNKSSLKSKLRNLHGKSYRHSYAAVIRALSTTGFTVKQKMGYSWLPFGRTSENRLVPLLATIEKTFALRRMPRWSPWVIVHAVKPKCSYAK
ncbi:MAG: class I SAM-dependent methyltransferase [Candidatus Bathyarchaeota archaeon]|nr:class I SAM-dependent methyltransferase [Candidatus Bathyarchaeota archaeon]